MDLANFLLSTGKFDTAQRN